MADSEAMCTVVVSLAPQAQAPLLLLGIRDEFTGRPWQPPARHWPAPQWSPLIGGRDEQAGGTWLAVHPELSRVGCVLNGRGEFAPPDRRRSRGDLPLRAAAEGRLALEDRASTSGVKIEGVDEEASEGRCRIEEVAVTRDEDVQAQRAVGEVLPKPADAVPAKPSEAPTLPPPPAPPAVSP